MGFINDFAVMCGKEAYRMLAADKSFAPHETYMCGTDYLCIWRRAIWPTWPAHSTDVERKESAHVYSVLEELEEYDGDENEDYAYKYIRIGDDDGDIETGSNRVAKAMDIYYDIEFTIPDGAVPVSAAEKKKELYVEGYCYFKTDAEDVETALRKFYEACEKAGINADNMKLNVEFCDIEG